MLRERWIASGAILTLALGAMLTLGACNRNGVAAREVMFELNPSRSEVLVGENVTIFASSENVLGRDSQIEWDASGGELFTEENGRLARVYFDEPGTYIVQANLVLDGRLARNASTTIEVNEVP